MAKIALIVRADRTGLGNQTYDLYRHLRLHKTLVVDISTYSGFANDFEKYPGVKIHKGFLDQEAIEWLTDDVDLVFSVEIPYNYKLFKRAREKGVRSVLQFNYEFLDYLNQPNIDFPDVLLAPSRWHFDDVRHRFGNQTQVKYLPAPVDRGAIRFHKRNSADHFLHIAGHPLYEDRNGTQSLLEAIPHIKKDVKITIKSQYKLEEVSDPRITYDYSEPKDYADLYGPEFDILILPRKFGGLSLQANEALAAGIPVIMPSVSPQDAFLLPELMFPTSGIKEVMTRIMIECHILDPKILAAKIDAISGSDISYLNAWANAFAESISWKNLLPVYEKFLEGAICR